MSPPTAPKVWGEQTDSAVPADFDPGSDSLTINGRPVDPMLGWVMTVPFNMLSTRPALSIPSGQAANGVPIGLQIVGAPFDDDTVCRAAPAFEAAGAGWQSPDPQIVDAAAKRRDAGI